RCEFPDPGLSLCQDDYPLAGSPFLDASAKGSRVVSELVEIAVRNGTLVQQGAAYTDGAGAGSYPVPGVVQGHATRRHEAQVRHRSENGLEVGHPEGICWKHFDDVRTGFPCRLNFCR